MQTNVWLVPASVYTEQQQQTSMCTLNKAPVSTYVYLMLFPLFQWAIWNKKALNYWNLSRKGTVKNKYIHLCKIHSLHDDIAWVKIYISQDKHKQLRVVTVSGYICCNFVYITHLEL